MGRLRWFALLAALSLGLPLDRAQAMDNSNSLPTMGIEWEFNTNMIGIIGTDDHQKFTDVMAYSAGQRMFCTAEGMNGRPLVSFTWDQNHEETNWRVLEIVTAPIPYSDANTWNRVLEDIRQFFALLQGNDNRMNSEKGRPFKAISLAELLPKLQFKYSTGAQCGGDDWVNTKLDIKPESLSKMFFMYKPDLTVETATNGSGTTTNGSTHVTLMLPLAKLLDKTHMLALYPSPSAARDIYSNTVDALMRAAPPKPDSGDDQRLGFWALYFNALNVDVYSDVNGVGGVRFKDFFSLYPKTTLGQAYRAVNSVAKTVDVGPFRLSDKTPPAATDIWTTLICIRPIDEFAEQADKAKHDAKCQQVKDKANTLVANSRWNATIVAIPPAKDAPAKDSPYVIEKPIGAFIETVASGPQVAVLLENRDNTPLADAAQLMPGLNLKDRNKIVTLLSPFQHAGKLEAFKH